MHRLTTNLEPLLSKELERSTFAAIGGFLPFLIFVGWIQITHGALSTFSRRLDWLSTDVSLPDSYVGLWDWFSMKPSPLPARMPLPGWNAF